MTGPDAVTITSSCAGDAVRTVADVRVARDVAYVGRGTQRLHLDVAWPSGRTSPLVLLLHGGGWSGGTRASMHAEMHALARRGFAAAAVEYRLAEAPHNVFPASLHDVKCALRFLTTNAAEYGVDPTRVAAAGFSAGGHLASMLGTAEDTVGRRVNEACGSRDEPLRGVISYAGPQDLRVRGPYTAEQERLVTNFLGAFSGDAPALAESASPLAHVRTGAPPFLLVHGTADELVPLHHAHWMRDALHQVGTPATALELRGQGHEWVGLVASRNATVRCTSLGFLDRWLR